jgi:hypothetical protein
MQVLNICVLFLLNGFGIFNCLIRARTDGIHDIFSYLMRFCGIALVLRSEILISRHTLTLNPHELE